MQARPTAPAIACDVFCRVVDNFGDAAVAWRLARILAREHGYAVRLLIDRPEVLARLLQRNGSAPMPWLVDEVVIESLDQSHASAAALLIEAFGCGLPEGWIAARPANALPAVLINVEYLSAEQWPDGVHRLSSPARADLPQRHFFFPGFSENTGGLLRENHVAARRTAWLKDASVARGLWQRLGLPSQQPDMLRVSMFCYEHGFGAHWFERLVGQGCVPLHLILAEGVMSQQVLDFCGASVAGSTRQMGDLRVSVVPFLPQDEFDQLLTLCHGNIVRGEDSFVRAQLAGRLEDLRRSLDAPPHSSFEGIVADAGDFAGASELAERVRPAGLDAAVAIFGRGEWTSGTLLQLPEADWRTVLDEMLTAHFAFARAIVPLLAERTGTLYLSLGGGAAFAPMRDAGLMSIAAAGQLMLTRTLESECGTEPPRIRELIVNGAIVAREDEPATRPGAITAAAVGRVVTELVLRGVTTWEAAEVDGPFVVMNERSREAPLADAEDDLIPAVRPFDRALRIARFGERKHFALGWLQAPCVEQRAQRIQSFDRRFR